MIYLLLRFEFHKAEWSHVSAEARDLISGLLVKVRSWPWPVLRIQIHVDLNSDLVGEKNAKQNHVKKCRVMLVRFLKTVYFKDQKCTPKRILFFLLL